MKPKFKVGQIIKHLEFGRGKIVDVKIHGYFDSCVHYIYYGVLFDRPNIDFHNLNSQLEVNRGWYCLEDRIKSDVTSILMNINNKVNK